MRFASLLVYTPRRRDPESLGPEPRRIMGMVKGARPDALERVAIRCSEFRRCSGEPPGCQRPMSSPRPIGREWTNWVDSIEWQGGLGSNLTQIILVDDVVTRGTTFLAAREVIRREQPWLEFEGFAAVRTMSFDVATEPLRATTGVIELQVNG